MLTHNEGADLLSAVTIKADNKSHISIKEPATCAKKCEDKPCTYFCPSQVYSWNGKRIEINYSRCIECGASVMGCPYGNIHWIYPSAGYGVRHYY